MSERASKKVLRELALLAALDTAGAKIDTSGIPEIVDWSGAVTGKFYGASVKKPTVASRLASKLSALFRQRAENQPGFFPGYISRAAREVSGKIEHERGKDTSIEGAVAYVDMPASQLVAACLSRENEGAWGEFFRRSEPLIKQVVTRTLHRQARNVSYELVDDLVQDIYLKLCRDDFRVLRSLDLRHENALHSFLKVLAANTVRDSLRSTAAIARGSAAPTGLESFDAPELGNTSEKIKRGILIAEIDQLLRKHSNERNFARNHKIFWLYFRDGLTAQQISALPEIGSTTKEVETILRLLTHRVSSTLSREQK